ncbi:MAG TPA: hypothetical protein VJV79_00030 [Polyangiaceae bacterium]|nr:hypothetical protein [Polyangiaceae bacterium]
MTVDGWRKATYGDVMREMDQRAEQAIHLPVLSVTKARGPMLASERFAKVMHGRDLGRYRLAPRNCVVADPMLLWDGSIGLQQVVDTGLVSPDYRVYRPEPHVEPCYLGYVVRSPQMLPHYEGGARGTNVRRNRIARSDFLAIPVNLPPTTEQRKIATILASVDDAIAATQAVIGQLQVVNVAMMAELLTRGVPGRHTRFKPTAIGNVPASWDVVRAETIFSEGPSNGRSPIATVTPPGVPTFSISAVRGGRVNIAGNVKYAAGDPSSLQGALLSVGDILIVRGNGNPAFVGLCGMVVEEPPNGCIYPDILMKVRPISGVLSDFLVAAWNSPVIHEQILNKAKTTNGTYKINGQDVRDILFPVPDLEEQRLIAQSREAVQANASRHAEELDALNTLKTALMAVLLTGEVRVKPDPESA